MKIFKSITTGLLLFLLSTTLSLAQTTKPGIVISTLNIQDAKIVNQVNNVFHITFSINNRQGLQTGVKYAAELVSDTKTGQVVVDQKIYDETLTVAPNSSLKKDIIYTAPNNLSGNYTILLTSSNSSGFNFGLTQAGKVKLVASDKSVVIAPESCFTQITSIKDPVKYSLNEAVNLSADQTLTLSCTATNQLSSGLSLLPIAETHAASIYGAVVDQKGGDLRAVDFKSQETKTFSVVLPKASDPQTYAVALKLSNGGINTNTVIANYKIAGTSVSILKLSTDKDYYKGGDVAKVSTLITPFSDSSIKFSLSVKDDQGNLCAGELSQNILPKTTSLIDSSISIQRSCFNPHILAVLKNDKGVVLDQKDFAIQTTSVPRPAEPFTSRYFVPLLLALIVVIVGIAIYLKKKKASTVILPIIFLAASLSLLSANTAHADAYYAGGPNGYVITTVNIDNSVYLPGATIYVTTAKVQYTAPSGDPALSTDLKAQTNSQLDQLIPMLIMSPGDINIQPLVNTFTAPVTPAVNTYSVLFTTGVDTTNGGGNQCVSSVRFSGQYRWGRVHYIGPAFHGPITVTVTLVGSNVPWQTVGGDRQVIFTIPSNSNHSIHNGVDCTTFSGAGCEIDGTSGFDHGWVSATDNVSVCGESTQRYSSCFVADTQVTLADGTKKNIQDIKIGDVLKGETTNNTVLNFHRPKLDGKVYSFNGGRYFVTEEHPFKTTDGWKSINPEKTLSENIGITVTQLKVGDTLITDHGLVRLNTIDSKIEPNSTQLYNFILTGDHTYYADGYLVHNKAQCDENNSCGNNLPCVDQISGYPVTPPPAGVCPAQCEYTSQAGGSVYHPFCNNSGGGYYCPDASGQC